MLRTPLLFLLISLRIGIFAADATPGVPKSELIVHTTSGPVFGYVDSTTTEISLNKWLGIPFAEDTGGQNRWRPPIPRRPTNSLINATAYGPACLQGRSDRRLDATT